MRLLLTSAGVKNASIEDALVDLLGKPIAESGALCIPTAQYGHPQVSPEMTWSFISGREARCPMCELGWKSLGVLELTALPSIDEERWVPWVREADVLLVGGGDPLYLCHWLRQSGLADLLPSLEDTVWVGLSAGSMVMTPSIGEDFVVWQPPTGGDETLGVVDFSIFPHVDHEDLPENTMAHAERWAAGMSVPAYAIDDETAIKVTDGAVDVVGSVIGLALGLGATLAWAYVAWVTVGGAMAGEVPQRAWRLGAIAFSILFAFRVFSGVFVVFGANAQGVGLVAIVVSLGAWVILVVAFALGLPTPAEAVEAQVTTTADPPAVTQPGSARD